MSETKSEEQAAAAAPQWDIPEGEFCIYGKVYAHPEHAEKIQAFYRETMRLFPTGEGTIHYCISRDRQDPNTFHLFERHTSKEIFEDHNNQEFVKEFLTSDWVKGYDVAFTKPVKPFENDEEYKETGTNA